MPRIPEIKSLNANSAQVFNAVRGDLGDFFKSVVPTANNDMGNMREIGSILLNNPELSNAFLSALVNRIGRVILSSREYSNPWARFKKGLMEYGETVEEIFVNIANPNNFNPEDAENTLFKRTIPDVRSTFHVMNYQKHYDTTVSNDQLRQAFLSASGITDLISKIIDSLYTSANYDEFISMKYVIAMQILKGGMTNVNIPDNTAPAEDIMEVIKATSDSLEFLTDEYNYAGVSTSSTKNEQFLILNPKFNAKMDVKVLANAFNMDKAEFLGHQVLVNSFGFDKKELERLDLLFGSDLNYHPIDSAENEMLKNVPCVLVDANYFMVFDNYNNMTEQYNGKGLYWNYFYHVWKTFSSSPFANSVLFSSTEATVTSVSVTPSTATLSKGASLQLKALVSGTGFVDQRVTYSVPEGVASVVLPDGTVKISESETETTITVTVKSVADSTKSATCTITVSE